MKLIYYYLSYFGDRERSNAATGSARHISFILLKSSGSQRRDPTIIEKNSVRYPEITWFAGSISLKIIAFRLGRAPKKCHRGPRSRLRLHAASFLFVSLSLLINRNPGKGLIFGINHWPGGPGSGSPGEKGPIGTHPLQGRLRDSGAYLDQTLDQPGWGGGGAICYDSGLITRLKTPHIQIISAIFEALAIREEFGKVSTKFYLRMATKKGRALSGPALIFGNRNLIHGVPPQLIEKNTFHPKSRPNATPATRKAASWQFPTIRQATHPNIRGTGKHN
jgi:hypothetical protein